MGLMGLATWACITHTPTIRNLLYSDLDSICSYTARILFVDADLIEKLYSTTCTTFFPVRFLIPGYNQLQYLLLSCMYTPSFSM